MENYLHISFVLINVFQTGPWHYERECAVSYIQTCSSFLYKQVWNTYKESAVTKQIGYNKHILSNIPWKFPLNPLNVWEVVAEINFFELN